MRNASAKLRVLVAASCLAGAGCFSFERAPPARLLVLADAQELGLSLEPQPIAGVSIGLGPVELPEYLRGDGVMARSEPTRIAPLPAERWAEPLDKAVSRVLARDLALALGAPSVELHPWLRASAPDLQVRVWFWRLEPGSGDQAQLVARWEVLDAHAGSVLLQRETRNLQPLEGERGTAAAEALSAALAALAEEIAGGLREVAAGVAGG